MNTSEGETHTCAPRGRWDEVLLPREFVVQSAQHSLGQVRHVVGDAQLVVPVPTSAPLTHPSLVVSNDCAIGRLVGRGGVVGGIHSEC